MSTRKSIRQKPPRQRILEGLTATLATVNFILVIFDLTYISSRYFWLTGKFTVPIANRELSLKPISFLTRPLAKTYDPIKGIKPNEDVQTYLDKLDELQRYRRSLGSEEAEEIILDLQELSIRMLEEDPFQLTGKTGTLEKIQNRIRGYTREESSEAAFRRFWTQNFLIGTPEDDDALTWFTENIQPLIERSNYRREIDRSGEFVNNFFVIDIFIFRIYFLIELICRVISIKRESPSISWREAILRRWYDLFLVSPLIPVMLWLRVLPVLVRLREAGVNLEPIRAQFSRGFVAIFAGELTEVIALQAVNQLQSSIRRGEISTWLMESSQKTYIDLNDINEVEVISRRLAKLIVYSVLPKVQPDVEALLSYGVGLALNQSPVYQGIQQLPVVSGLQTQFSQQFAATTSKLITEVSQGAYDALTADDPVALELIDRLSEHFRQAFTEALQDEATLQELQSLLVALLEEVKVNYVRKLSEEDFEQLLEEAERLNRR